MPGPIVAFNLPAVPPAFAAPISSAPAPELGSIDHATFAKFEQAFTSIWPTGVNAQCFYAPVIGIHAESIVAQHKVTILPGKFLQPIRNVDMALVRPILSA